jgi:hypothetical protein
MDGVAVSEERAGLDQREHEASDRTGNIRTLPESRTSLLTCCSRGPRWRRTSVGCRAYIGRDCGQFIIEWIEEELYAAAIGETDVCRFRALGAHTAGDSLRRSSRCATLPRVLRTPSRRRRTFVFQLLNLVNLFSGLGLP